jgi:hypothetical protein
MFCTGQNWKFLVLDMEKSTYSEACKGNGKKPVAGRFAKQNDPVAS